MSHLPQWGNLSVDVPEQSTRNAELLIPDQDSVTRIETFPLQIPRDEPYLGSLEAGTSANSRGTFVRPGNRTLYSIHDHSVLIKMMTRSGLVGWGECFGVVAPEIVSTIVESLCEPMVIGRNPHEVVAIFDDLYDSLRVRGYFGGFWLDAIAGIDMALWDSNPIGQWHHITECLTIPCPTAR